MSDFKLGDLVWAKMKGFPPWPGVIVQPPKELKKVSAKKNVGNHCIYFFGTKNYGWIEESKLKPYDDFKEEFNKAAKSAAFKEALLEIEDFSLKGNSSLNISGTEKDLDVSVKSPESLSDSETVPKIKSKRVSFDESFGKEDDSKDKTCREIDLSSSASKQTPGSSKKIHKKRTLEDGSSVLDSKDNVNKTRPPKKRFSDVSSDAKPRKMKKFPDADTTTPLVSHQPEDTTVKKEDIDKQEETNLDSEAEAQQKKLQPGEFKIGFIGLGVMGSAIVKNLLKSGHVVTVWNRTADKCKDFPAAGSKVAQTPRELAMSSDVVCCCVSDSNAAKEIVFGSNGLLSEMHNRALVQMTGIDTGVSLDIAEAITSNGGRYLEAQIHGSKTEAEEGSLIVLTAGNRSLFEDCCSLFESCARRAMFLGDVGNASKMYIVLQLITGITLAGLAEGMALADRTGIEQAKLLEIIQMSMIDCPLVSAKSEAIKNCDYKAHMALGNQQKDLKLALSLADSLEQPVPLAATSNELYKHAKRLGYGDHDAAAIFVRARF